MWPDNMLLIFQNRSVSYLSFDCLFLLSLQFSFGDDSTTYAREWFSASAVRLV